MKKNTLKAFTLVEMLIVIVIIGILIAALMPRMSAAQGRARDVSRKTALSNIQSAIVTSQTDKGKRPGMDSAKNGIDIKDIADDLKAAGMTTIPKDPLQASTFSGLGNPGSGGEFRYMVAKRNGTDNAGFVLMAKTEVEGGSNWVYCGDSLEKGKISNTDDLSKLTLCSTLTKTGSNSHCKANTGACEYSEEGQLRYIVIY